MGAIDFFLVIAFVGFVLSGLWFGVIHMIGVVVGLFAGAIVGGLYFSSIGEILLPMVGGNENLANLLAFFGLFVIVSRLVGFIFFFLEKIFNLIAIIPFLKTFNRLLGGILGLLEGTLVLGLLVYFAGRFPFSESFAEALASSPIARAFNTLGSILAPFLPEAVRALKTIF
jgi:uncharacterized membrane protein required for colicin V production